MKATELADSLDTISSSAAEGQLLAQGVAGDETKATFTRVRARELTETLSHELEKLTDAEAATPAVAGAKRRAITLADDASKLIGDLQVAPTDRAGAAAAEKRLKALAKQADDLGKREQ